MWQCTKYTIYFNASSSLDPCLRSRENTPNTTIDHASRSFFFFEIFTPTLSGTPWPESRTRSTNGWQKTEFKGLVDLGDNKSYPGGPFHMFSYFFSLIWGRWSQFDQFKLQVFSEVVQEKPNVVTLPKRQCKKSPWNLAENPVVLSFTGRKTEKTGSKQFAQQWDY